MRTSKLAALQALGIQGWSLRPERPAARVEAGVAADAPASQPVQISVALQAAMPDLTTLQLQVAGCTKCGLCKSRTQTVFSAGVTSARWMIVGEAPGAEEDARGEPFVGQAGRLLDNMLQSIGLSRHENVYIANVLKCRPPGNRNPEPSEIAHCTPYLMRQIELVAPEMLIVMGRFAAQTLLNTEASISSLRGRVHEVAIGSGSIKAVVSYHPAYVLRKLPEKAKSWADLLLAKRAVTS
jgi:uracil-DNA glycosylase